MTTIGRDHAIEGAWPLVGFVLPSTARMLEGPQSTAHPGERENMRSKLSAIALATAVTAAAPAAASAAPPERVPVPADPITFEAGQVCDFPISVTSVQQGEKITFFSDGRARLTGVSKGRYTNLDNGHSIVINASGPAWLDRNIGQGHSSFVLFPEDVGGPGIFLFHGRVSYTRDENGFFTSITGTGSRSGNLCAAIA
jgi:hypothetical protein